MDGINAIAQSNRHEDGDQDGNSSSGFHKGSDNQKDQIDEQRCDDFVINVISHPQAHVLRNLLHRKDPGKHIGSTDNKHYIDGAVGSFQKEAGKFTKANGAG